MVDNFDLILDYMKFWSSTEFYFVQLLKRKSKGADKDGVLRSYYIYDTEQLLHKKDRIIELCSLNNARAYIRLNKRDDETICLKSIEYLAECIRTGNTNCSNLWEVVSGKYRDTTYPQTWLVDLDTKDSDILNSTVSLINSVKGSDCNNRVQLIVPTVNGYHLITNTFNRDEFNKKSELKIEIHKDSPTLLFA